MDRYKITFETWDKVASLYQDKFMDMDLYNDTYDAFCNHIGKTNPQLLEIGCGPGNITKYMLQKRPDFNIDAIDVAPSMIKLAKENNPTANFITMDCRTINTLTTKYDAIMCGFCLPYLSKEDCEKLIKDSSFLLNKGGIIYLSAIEDDYKKSGFETNSTGLNKVYVYYHQAEILKEILEENNFELTNIFRKEYAKTDVITSTHLFLIAKLELPPSIK